jgi:hypothetical protein
MPLRARLPKLGTIKSGLPMPEAVDAARESLSVSLGMRKPRRDTPPVPTVAEFWSEYVREANEMLSLVRGESACWWIYSVSMRTFEVVIGDPSARGGNILLQTLGTDSITGPTRWTMQDLEVVYHGPKTELCYELRDEAVGLRVIASSFRWELDIDLPNRQGEIGFR